MSGGCCRAPWMGQSRWQTGQGSWTAALSGILWHSAVNEDTTHGPVAAAWVVEAMAAVNRNPKVLRVPTPLFPRADAGGGGLPCGTVKLLGTHISQKCAPYERKCPSYRRA